MSPTTPKTFEQRKRTMLELFSDPRYTPMKLKELAILLDIPREEREDLKAVLDSLLAEGKISLSSRGKYAGAAMFAKTGLFSGTRRGFGFVTPEEGGNDIFIPEEDTCGAFHGDTVQYLVVGEGHGGRRAWGRVVKVVKRGITEVIGTYERNKKNGFVIPDNQKLSYDVFIPAGQSLNAVDGHKVVAKLKNYGDKGHNPEGTITRILGHRNDPGVDIQSIVMAYGLPVEFPEAVMQQVSYIPDHVTGEDREGRLDLRDVTCVTI
ncbi:MAG: ribonuclease R, partial [Lachnospiraceae bacterium]|nr:ribonuclease R [Lachnospiraceae bacterium]